MVCFTSEDVVKKWTKNIHIVRSTFTVCALMMLMASLSLPILGRAVPAMGKMAHFDFLFFSYRVWREGEVKEDSRKKTFISIALVCISCAYLSFGQLLAMLGYTRVLLVGNIVTMLMLVFSVINMYMGMHHFNLSPAVNYVGTLSWGPSQTIHVVSAAILLLPTIYLIYEYRNAKAGVNVCPNPALRRCIVAFPLVITSILVVAGSGVAQAINTDKPNYTTSWHYDLMSFDYTLTYMADKIVCARFYNRLVAGGAMTVSAGCFMLVSLLLNIFAPNRSLVAWVILVVSFCFTICSVALSGSLIEVIVCDDESRTQGDLTFGHGFTCLFIALGMSFFGSMLGSLTFWYHFEEKETEQINTERVFLVSQGEVANYNA